MRKTHWFILALILALTLTSGAVSAQPLSAQPQIDIGTSFSYQGLLKWNGQPANGSYDFLFRLYQEPEGINQLGADLLLEDVPVSDGLFAVQLDFGQIFYNDEARYLQVAVRPGAESGDFTTLSPLRFISPVPYALFAGSASWNSLTNMPSGFADGIDNDTQYNASTGLELMDGNFSISHNYTLPQGCADGQVPKWIVNTWYCQDDNGQSYTAGTGLSLAGSAFQIAASYRLPQTCSDGQVAKWNDGAGEWQCANDTDLPYTAGDGIQISDHLVSATGSSYQNVVIVAKSGGDFTTVSAAVSSIGGASANNPYLVWVAPGSYTESTVVMKEWVDIQGAGQNVTTIIGSGFINPMTGVVIGANNASLRDLTVISDGNTYPVAVYLDGASPTLQRVTLKALNSDGVGMALEMRDSDPLVEDATLYCNGIDSGVVCAHISLNSNPVFRNLSITVEGTCQMEFTGLFNYYGSNTVIDGLEITLSGTGCFSNAGIRNNEADIDLRNVRIQNNMTGSDTRYGIMNTNSDSILRMNGGKVEVYFGDGECYGIYSDNGIVYLDNMEVHTWCSFYYSDSAGLFLSYSTGILQQSLIDGWYNTGIRMNAAILEAHHSRILGETQTIQTANDYDIKLADTQLSGAKIFHGTGAGSETCIGVYDENLANSGGYNACP